MLLLTARNMSSYVFVDHQKWGVSGVLNESGPSNSERGGSAAVGWRCLGVCIIGGLLNLQNAHTNLFQ